MLNEGRIVACVATAAFLFQFEAFVVNVSLPTMAKAFDTTTTFISFVVIAYLLAANMALLPAGRLGDRIGLARVFLAGCALAALGTLASGLAVNLPMIYASRLVQGVGTGMMVAMGYAMIPAWLPRERTGWGYGYVSLGAGLGMACGLPAGGLLSDAMSWRWVFLATLPVMLLLLMVAWRVLPRSLPQRPSEDGIGLGAALLFGAMLASTVLAVSLGDELGWHSPAIVGLAVAAIVLGAAMGIRARVSGRSYFPRAVFRSPAFTLGLVVLFVFAATTSGVAFLIPFYLQVVCGLSSVASSIVFMAYPVSSALCAALAGRWADRIGSRPLVATAGGVAAFAAATFSVTLQGSQVWIPTLFLIAFGISCGLFYAPNNRYIMAASPAGSRGEQASVLPMALNLGSMMGVALFETAFSTMLPDGKASIAQLFAAGAEGRPAIDHAFGHAFALIAIGPVLCASAAAFAYRTGGAIRD